MEIARKEKVNAIRVYFLAHGKKAKSEKDYSVIKSLIQKGIVSGWRIGNSA
ncbi:hypothetical protein [Dysgonomonas sp. BGC7]|uniref:hypothetical protein n=1 Tax=Dysgonomonas sp. BGC7 TaxID=1658008 RepID=UPI000A760F70|nr:hypothetical protein [Dysgonomonas sp. BGC7]MBD8388256.1 hypothetical protein [Dysgonomonas sp. BGC7]